MLGVFKRLKEFALKCRGCYASIRCGSSNLIIIEALQPCLSNIEQYLSKLKQNPSIAWCELYTDYSVNAALIKIKESSNTKEIAETIAQDLEYRGISVNRKF